MAVLGQAWVTLGTKDTDLKSGLAKARRQVDTDVSAMQSRLKGLAFGTISTAGLVAGLRAGIKEIDDFKLSTIGIAATLTDMAKKGSGDLKQVYQANLSYAESTYKKVELAAAKYFASGKEMIDAWKILTQKGTLVTSAADIENLGVVVDKIKLLTQGQTSSLQIAQELRAVMNGQAKATDQLALILKDQIGPEWENQLNKAREQGTVLEWMAGQFQGLKQATADITNTWEAQVSTLDTLIRQTGRSGLAGAYQDMVGIVSDINGYLTEHGDEVAGTIRTAWNSVKSIVTDPTMKEFFTTTLKSGVSAGKDLAGALGLVGNALRDILFIYNSFPSEVTGPAGTGIIVRVLTGSNSIAAIVAMCQLSSMGLKSVTQSMRDTATAAQNILDVMSGKLDWNTGAEKPQFGEGSIIRKPIPSPGAMIKKPIPFSVPEIVAPKGTGSGGKGPAALGADQVDQYVTAMREKLHGSIADLEKANYDLWIAVAEAANDPIKAGALKVDQWIAEERAKIDKDWAEMEAKARELEQKLSGAKGGATEAAWAELSKAQGEVDKSREVMQQRYLVLMEQEKQKRLELVTLPPKILEALDQELALTKYVGKELDVQVELQQQLNALKQQSIALSPEATGMLEGKVRAGEQAKYVQQKVGQSITGPMDSKQFLASTKEMYAAIDKLRADRVINEATAHQAMFDIWKQSVEARVQLEGSAADIMLASFAKITDGFNGMASGLTQTFGSFFTSFTDGFANSVGRAIVYSESLQEAMTNVAREGISSLISGLIKLGIQWAIMQILGKTMATTGAAVSAALGVSTAAAWAPAAAMVSLATFGSNAAPAMIGISSTVGLAETLSAIGAVGAFAKGGRPVTGQAALIGERGPELWVPDRPGTIIPNNRLLGGGSTALGMPQVNVYNYGSSKISTEITPDEIRIIARDEAKGVVHRETDGIVANHIADPNSRSSRAISRNTKTQRLRD